MNEVTRQWIDRILTVIGSVLIAIFTVYMTGSHEDTNRLNDILSNKVNKEDFNKKCEELKSDIDKKAPLEFVKTINDKLDRIIMFQLERNMNNQRSSAKIDSIYFPVKRQRIDTSFKNQRFAQKNNKLGT